MTEWRRRAEHGSACERLLSPLSEERAGTETRLFRSLRREPAGQDEPGGEAGRPTRRGSGVSSD